MKKQYSHMKTAIPEVVDAVSILNDKSAGVRRLIDEAKDAPAELARIYIKLRAMLEEVSEAVGKLSELRDALQFKLIPEAYEAHGVTSQTVDDHRITVSILVRATIVPEQKEAAHQWLRDHGYNSLILQTVNASSLASLAKMLIQDEGKELPDDKFKTYTVPSTSMTKTK